MNIKGDVNFKFVEFVGSRLTALDKEMGLIWRKRHQLPTRWSCRAGFMAAQGMRAGETALVRTTTISQQH